MAHLSCTTFFWYKKLLLSLVQNLEKFSQQIHSYECAPFLGPKWSICPKQNIFWKNISIILIYLLATFIVQNFLKNSPGGSRVNKDAQFLGPEWPISPNENFFRKPVHEPCFFYSCLSTCQKSKSDINLLVKY